MATLSGNKIKDTYQSLIKLTDNGNLTTGAKQLTDGFGNNSPLYISTTQIGIGVTPEATYDLHVYSNAKVGGNLTVTGDLTVEGTTTTIDTQTLTVEDPLIEVASNNTSTDAVDIGFYGRYAPSGTTLYAGLFRDTGDSKFKLFRNLEEQPTTTVNTSGTGYTVATLVADVEGTLTGTIASSTVATTQSAGDNSTKVATTAYVDASIGNSTLAEVLANGNTTGGTDIAVSANDDITFTSTSKAIFGGSLDLQVYSDGSNNYIDSTSNELRIRSNDLRLLNYGTAKYITADNGADVSLYYNNSKKFETTSTGVTVTGGLSTSNSITLTNPTDKYIRFIDTYGNWDIEVGDGANNFKIHSESLAADYLTLEGDGQLNLGEYGSGSFTGTATYRLAVDSSGDVIEIPIGGGAVDGSGTANTVTMWSDTDTITDAPITISGNNSTFAGKIIAGGGVQFTGGSISTATAVLHTNNVVYFRGGSNGLFLQNADGSEGMFMANDHIRFETSSTERMRIDSSGNVGIGVSAPSYLLDVRKASNGVISSFRIEDGVNNPRLLIYGSSSGSHIQHTWSSNADNLIFEVGGSEGSGTERMRIDSSGSILYQTGSGKGYEFGASGSSAGVANMFCPSGYTLAFGTNNTERMRIDSSGNVGIGTTSPSDKVHSVGGYLSTGLANPSNTNIGSVQLGYDGTRGILRTWNSSPLQLNAYNNIEFYTSGSERMRIDSSGQVGIGTDSPSVRTHIYDSSTDAVLYIDSGNANGSHARFLANGSVKHFIGSGGGFSLGDVDDFAIRAFDNLIFATNNTSTERMHIDSSGDTTHIASYAGGTFPFRVGFGTYSSFTPTFVIDDNGNVGIDTTSPTAKLDVNGEINASDDINATNAKIFASKNGDVAGIFNRNTSTGNVVLWRYANTQVGSVVVNVSSTVYLTTSDYRLKENIVEMTGALDRVNQLKPKRFNFIADANTTVDGFLAHEVQDIVPEAIHGVKDELDEENNPVYQGIDQSKLVPLLVGAIQELKAEIETLKAQINN